MSGFETVACCDDCWWGDDPAFIPNGRGIVEDGIRQPLRLVQEARNEEFCHFCGWTTWSGIYIRIDTHKEPAASLRARKEIL